MHRRLRQKSLPSAFLVCVFRCRAAAAAAAARCQNSCDFDTLPNAVVPPASQSCGRLSYEEQTPNARAPGPLSPPSLTPHLLLPSRLLAIKEEFRANQHVDSEKASRFAFHCSFSAAQQWFTRWPWSHMNWRQPPQAHHCCNEPACQVHFTPHGCKATHRLLVCIPMTTISHIQQHGKPFTKAWGLEHQLRWADPPIAALLQPRSVAEVAVVFVDSHALGPVRHPELFRKKPDWWQWRGRCCLKGITTVITELYKDPRVAPQMIHTEKKSMFMICNWRHCTVPSGDTIGYLKPFHRCERRMSCLQGSSKTYEQKTI